MMTWHNNVRSKLDGRTQFIMKIKTGTHRSRSVEVDGPTDRAMAVRRSLWITSSSCAKRFFTFYCGIGMLLADLRMHRILRIVHHDFIIIYHIVAVSRRFNGHLQTSFRSVRQNRFRGSLRVPSG